MIKKQAGEVWKPISFPGWRQLRNRYAVSNQGRIASFKKNVLNDGKLLSGSLTTGYRTLNLHRADNKGTLYIHREMAKLFLKKPSPKHRYVVHKNHKKLDNKVKNLMWATLDQMIEHQQKSPAKKAYKVKQASRTSGLKLTASEVKKIKSVLANKKRKITIKRLAENYGVSEMTIYRIKSGENWAKVK
ncbi:MAG: NUMOD4 domain-containing protein [Chitinophagaceae bacterium]|nr:HTH domain-containing protein [Chitinophagaceae bacterium]MCB0741100.1 HTH domain-containing protein [Chitinophagaceae bacterium]HQU56160.1 NUMOD4 domain-containing protein [Chitinophagaceae bacterium]HQV05939.1 NUMOD4 domain-containing protein [Chitinophagaceae bacterium]